MAEPEQPPTEPAHDILAAEAFGVPAPDPELRRRPVVLPDDPTGIEEPHDVLAAEEFPMPAPPGRRPTAVSGRRRGSARLVAPLAAVAVVGSALVRRRSRQRPSARRR